MKKFVIEDEFWEVFPKAKIGIVVLKGIDNSIKDEKKYADLLLNAEKKAMEYLTDDDFSDNSIIHVWREAFQKFKTKKGARSSIEALMKRVKKGDHIGTINPLVDIYNSISLKYALPCGGETIDAFEGNIRLTKAIGNEAFITYGSNESEPPYAGEIIYKDDAGAICRCWNWREAMRTILKEDTKNAFMCIECIDENRIDDLKNALNELAHLAAEHLGASYEISILDIDHKEAVIE